MSNFEKYTLTDRPGGPRQQARRYREIYDKDYPQPDKIDRSDNSTDINEQLNYLKNMIRRTNLEHDNIRPIFISLEVLKKKKGKSMDKGFSGNFSSNISSESY
jgi:hypothetical protein